MTNQGKTIEEIHDYWEDHGRKELGEKDLPPKKRDETLQRIIEDAMTRYLHPGLRVLDIGCGDGTSTLRFHDVTGQALGIDFAAKRVQMAKRMAQNAGAQNIDFETGDVLNLGPTIERHGRFDVCTIIRCLINLPTWEDQARGLEQIALATNPGGLLIASEGWYEGLEAINLARERVGLRPIVLVTHNRYMTKREFEGCVGRFFDILDYVNLGFYLFMSRVFQPHYVKPSAPSHDHRINRSAGDFIANDLGRNEFTAFDYSGVYVLRRRGNKC